MTILMGLNVSLSPPSAHWLSPSPLTSLPTPLLFSPRASSSPALSLSSLSHLSPPLPSPTQKRGAAIIAARKLSSAASAAKAICDHLRDWTLGTDGRVVSMAVYSDGEA